MSVNSINNGLLQAIEQEVEQLEAQTQNSSQLYSNFPQFNGQACGQGFGGTNPGQFCGGGDPTTQMEQALIGALRNLVTAAQLGMEGGGQGFGNCYGPGQGQGGQGPGSCYGPGYGQCEPQTPWSASTSNGQATINTGRYTVTCNKSDSSYTVTDNQTGKQVMHVCGDPHFSANGQNFTFKKDTSFELPDGTVITDRTVPYGNGQTLSDELDISRGNQSMKVTGLAQNNGQPLQVTEGIPGYALAESNWGDPVVYDVNGQFLGQNGQLVDQNYANNNL